MNYEFLSVIIRSNVCACAFYDRPNLKVYVHPSNTFFFCFFCLAQLLIVIVCAESLFGTLLSIACTSRGLIKARNMEIFPSHGHNCCAPFTRRLNADDRGEGDLEELLT